VVDVDPSLNLEGGQYIPRQFTTDNGAVVSVDFSFTTSDGNNAHNSLSVDGVSAFISGINDANNNNANITSIGISATTNGEHSINSNHYVGNGARAFDISLINGRATGYSDNKFSVSQIQNSMNTLPNIRENFGPSLKTKMGKPSSVGGHSNHIHISVNKR
ncbi:RHS repeat-associated core domain-containing protein, partial [Paludibacteraceae bacterium OttesenSCG-928-F17]|nr:RHS repeat-associated core domain-containing protein [Paludibacteraceae bacterium OttesenSCG-928-F17]